jgi:hypothetical protein
MSRSARLAAYAVVLGLMFGGGVALGGAIGPDPDLASQTTTVDHDNSTDAPAHESDH